MAGWVTHLAINPVAKDSTTERDRVKNRDFVFVFGSCDFAELSVPVSLSCAQHSLRSLCTLKIPVDLSIREGLVPGGMKARR